MGLWRAVQLSVSSWTHRAFGSFWEPPTPPLVWSGPRPRHSLPHAELQYHSHRPLFFIYLSTTRCTLHTVRTSAYSTWSPLADRHIPGKMQPPYGTREPVRRGHAVGCDPPSCRVTLRRCRRKACSILATLPFRDVGAGMRTSFPGKRETALRAAQSPRFRRCLRGATVPPPDVMVQHPLGTYVRG